MKKHFLLFILSISYTFLQAQNIDPLLTKDSEDQEIWVIVL